MRLFFKSAFNGIGSGAGVAWPLFGIVFTLLGGSIGGLISLTLGLISISLFLTVSSIIFYLSYQELQNNEFLLQQQIQKNEQKLLVDIADYVQSININYSDGVDEVADFNEFFLLVLKRDLGALEAREKSSSLYQILIIMLAVYQQDKQLTQQTLLARITTVSAQQLAPGSKVIISAFFHFVGAFGAIAGCSAGVSGLLTGMGLFSSFAAFPLLGWGIIGGAVVLGLFSARNATIETRETFKHETLNQTFKNMHQQLRAATLARNLDTAMRQTKNSLTRDEQELFKHKMQPIFSLFDAKKGNKNKQSFAFLSFFKINSTPVNAAASSVSEDAIFDKSRIESFGK